MAHQSSSSSIITTAHRSSSSSIIYKWPYDVFLSFYGDDTRLGFVSHLYESLRRSGIRAFIDDKIRDEEHIISALFKAIEESRIAIIVFSENYASSTFCLKQLEKIVDCFKEESQLIYPVFYHVDPLELRNPRESYAKALAGLENRFKDQRQKVEKWRLLLSIAADLKGCHLKPKIANEQECITRITSEVATRINREPLHVANYPVGIVSKVKEVVSYLDLWSTEKIKMIGIWGAGGIGKSTIARALYNSIVDHFEGFCFLSNVRKRSKEPNGLSHLQETLLSRLVMETDHNLDDYHEGIPIIQRRLSQKKIMLILDDVDESNQLKALAGSCDWFGSGSRIIITTRNKQLLRSHGIESIYDVKGLNREESLNLLSWYAFKKENVDSNYVEVCNRAVDYSCGFPLVLEVIGSNLGDKGVDLWNSALQQFKSTPNERVLDALKLSYDALGKVEKQVFLDLACFFNGEKLANIIDILLCVRPIEPKYAIDMLIDKSLIKIEQARVTMHGFIEEVGKEIVRQESPNEPGKQSRLWFYQDILHVLQQDTGTNKVEAIILDLPESKKVQWSGEELMKMKNLKMLVIRKARFSECPKYLPNSLKWLEWKEYPFKFLPNRMCPTKLVYLGLSYSYCQFLQPFDEECLDLTRMDLRNCKFLQQIPDLSIAPNLTELCLDGCISLTEIHDSVGCLNKLRELSAMQCKNLKIFSSRLRLISLEYLNLSGCSSLLKFPEISIVMKEMRTLDLDKTAITELPSSVCNLIGLETLSVEECPNLKQLPASICTLPNLRKLTANSCEGLSHFEMGEGGDEASLYCSAMSSKMEQLCFSNCNLSDDSLAFCLSHFTNMIHLDLSFNNFTILPECIKEYHNLKVLLLDHCIQLEHIGGMPPNLDKFSAICCTSLTESSKGKVFKKALNIQPRKRNFILPGTELPEELHYYYYEGSFVTFWVRNVFPMASLWIVFKDHRDHVDNNEFSVHINDTKVDVISSTWAIPSRIMTDHIYICDMQSIIPNTELPLVNKWNQVKISFQSRAKEIYFGVHVYNRESNVENIQFIDPGRDNVAALFPEQRQWIDVEDYMDLDSNSAKYVESLDSQMHYQGFSQREICDPPIEALMEEEHDDNEKEEEGEEGHDDTVIPHGTLSSSITYNGPYHVFLNYCVEDRFYFIDLLRLCLLDEELHVFVHTGLRDDDITSTLFTPLHESRIAIVIFSENYAKSEICLQALVQILESFKEEGRLIFPVYCNVDPSEAWARLEERFKDKSDEVEKWKLALSQDYHSLTKTTDIREAIRAIVERVTTWMNEKEKEEEEEHDDNEKEDEEEHDDQKKKEGEEDEHDDKKNKGRDEEEDDDKKKKEREEEEHDDKRKKEGEEEEHDDNKNKGGEEEDDDQKKKEGEEEEHDDKKKKEGEEEEHDDNKNKGGEEEEDDDKKKKRRKEEEVHDDTIHVLLSYHDVEESEFANRLLVHLHQARLGVLCRFPVINSFIPKRQSTCNTSKTPHESRIAIIVLSKAYVKATSCLKQLVQILKCFKGEGRLIYPVFYDVDLSEALTQLEEKFKGKRNQVEVEEWKLAVTQAAGLSDYHHFLPGNMNEDECFGVIIGRVTAWMDEKDKYWVWEKVKRIGRGAHGIVYEAQHRRKTGATCAVKELNIDVAKAYEYLENEIKILSQLEEHPNIVKYYGHKQEGGRISLYMEYIQPGSLTKYISGVHLESKQRKLDRSLIQRFTAQILFGLVHLHRIRGVHRDLKPDNLLVDSKDIVKLTDFGLAKLVAESIGKHSVQGTLRYAAPELVQNNYVYKKSSEALAADIFSLGCILIEMFSGEQPFWPFCAWSPHIPEELCKEDKKFLERCFILQPANRPSAENLLEDSFVREQAIALKDIDFYKD